MRKQPDFSEVQAREQALEQEQREITRVVMKTDRIPFQKNGAKVHQLIDREGPTMENHSFGGGVSGRKRRVLYGWISP